MTLYPDPETVALRTKLEATVAHNAKLTSQKAAQKQRLLLLEERTKELREKLTMTEQRLEVSRSDVGINEGSALQRGGADSGPDSGLVRITQLAALREKNVSLRETLIAQRLDRAKVIDESRELRRLLRERNARLDAVVASARRLRSAQKATYLAGFAVRSSAFSVWVNDVVEDLPSPDLVVAHEDAALRALLELRLRNHCETWFDNVEYPDHFGRATQQDPIHASDISAVHAFKVAAINSVDRVFASSEGQAEALELLGVTRPVDVLRNCRYVEQQIDDRRIREDCGLSGQDRLVLHLNNSYQDGGSDLALQMLKTLPAEFHLAYLGATKLPGIDLEAMATELGVRDRCTFLDLVPSSELVRYISGSDVVLIPLMPGNRNFETCMPNRLFEAISARVPVVAHRDIAVGRFVDRHQIGVTFGERNPQSMASAVLEASNDESLPPLVARAALRYCWEEEGRRLQEVLAPGPGVVFLLGEKRIERYNRFARLAASFADTGKQVHVFARTLPLDDLAVPGVIYHSSEATYSEGRAHLVH